MVVFMSTTCNNAFSLFEVVKEGELCWTSLPF